jgi:acid phosphatase type 7
MMRRREGYESLLDAEELSKQRFAKGNAWLVLAFVSMVGLLALCASPNAKQLEDHDHKHTIPTLLSVVNHETGEYLVALENPLYERLKKARFTENHENVLESPKLRLSSFEIGVRDPLTLSWTSGKDIFGSSVLKDDDVIMLRCGNLDEIDLSQKQFLEAATIAQARATSQRHSGVSRVLQQWHFPSFPVLRHEICQFSLYQALPDARGMPQYSLLDQSSFLHIESSRSLPTGIHLALGNDPSEMVVQFTTGDQEGTPVARYSKHNGDSIKASGVSHTYTAGDMCEEPANVTEAGKFQPPGMIHVIRLTGLEPNTVYEYEVGFAHGQGITWSDTFSFTSSPVPGDATPFSYVVYGDQGCPGDGWGDGGKWISAMAEREVSNPDSPIRAVHHFGDLSYARGAAHIWDEWLNMISPVTTKIPLMISVGNHEVDYLGGGYRPIWGNFHNDSGGECAVPTLNHFTMPNSTGSNSVFWYAYSFGSVRTLVASTEHDLAPGSQQHTWLESELQSVDRSVTPWVLELHRPLYQSQMNWADNAVGIARRLELDQMLTDYKVDLVLAGHYHSYLRTCDGLRNSKCHNGGPMHITIGSAGAEFTLSDMYPNSWTEKFVMGNYGYGRITVANATAMLFEYVKAGDEKDEKAGSVLDSVWIKRER